MSMNIVYRKYL